MAQRGRPRKRIEKFVGLYISPQQRARLNFYQAQLNGRGQSEELNQDDALRIALDTAGVPAVVEATNEP